MTPLPIGPLYIAVGFLLFEAASNNKGLTSWVCFVWGGLCVVVGFSQFGG